MPLGKGILCLLWQVLPYKAGCFIRIATVFVWRMGISMVDTLETSDLHNFLPSAGGFYLSRNLGFDEHGKKRERFLPSEIASLRWNRVGDSLLDDIDLRSDEHLPQRDRCPHSPGQV